MRDELLNEFNLQGRVAVVTGAASGIGRETARTLAQGGARLVIADVNRDGLAETASAVEAEGGELLIRPTDVSSKNDIEGLANDAVARFGRIDIWVNAAGILIFAPILEVTEEDAERLLQINMMGTFWSCTAAARVMKDNGGGSIINIASAGADMPVPGNVTYSMSKAAVNMLTRTAAAEFGQHGVRVNSVAPGFVETPMVNYRFQNPDGTINPEKRDEVFRQRAQSVPLGVTGKPRDIATAIYFLASDASRFITGQIIRPNGGAIML